MTTASGEKPLELSVRNFGPIAEADIELRPLTVFVGPSNTGKSYLATLIYALHRFFGSYSVNPSTFSIASQALAHGVSSLIIQGKIDLSETEIDVISAWADSDWYQHLIGISQVEIVPYESDLPAGVSEVVRKVLRDIGQLSRDLDNEMARCFGTGGSQNLVRYPGEISSGLSVSGIATNVGRQTGKFSYDIALTSRGVNIAATISEAMPVMVKRHSRYPRPLPSLEGVSEEREIGARRILAELASNALASSLGALGRPAYYLPADRAGVAHSSRMIIGNLIADASRRYFHPDSPRAPVLTGVIGDFLEQLVALTSAAEPQELNALVADLEQNVLGGSVRVERSQIDYPTIVYRPTGWKHDLLLLNTSSMVSELAPVVLYLQHLVRSGDTLIIEEPESALHPAMQVELTRLLAAAVKAGIRIIITTHSEWVLEELANLVLMSELPVEHRQGFEGADLTLSPEELGVWSFQPTEDGSVVEELRFDEEVGKFPSDAGLVTAELYNRFANIANRIQRLKEA